jgi:hypothetical protein
VFVIIVENLRVELSGMREEETDERGERRGKGREKMSKNYV